MYTEQKKMINYNIITVEASKLIEKLNVRDYEFDYENPRQRRCFLKSTESYSDCALFYQLRKVLNVDASDNADAIKKFLIFVDFGNLFMGMSENKENRLKEIFETGISIRYSSEEIINYVPFDKSNSMSKKCKISFIDKRLLSSINHRLNLDMSFKNQRINLCKFYSYKGLYMSEGKRVCLDKSILDDTKVIVIDDNYAYAGFQEIFTAKKEDGSNKWIMLNADDPQNKYSKNYTEKRKEYKIDKMFDGEGIISPEYSKILNKECGMMRAEIILTKSMMKCSRWLMDELSGKEHDCMKYYFDKFHEYDHALYIGQSNLDYGMKQYTKLNYQLLNTLALSDAEFDEMIGDHMKWVKDPLGYLETVEKWSEDMTDDEGEESDDEKYYNYDNWTKENTWSYALSGNPVFSHEYRVKNNLKMISNGLKNDCAKGRLIVKGEVRYLSRDLLTFLIDMIASNDKISPVVVKHLNSMCIFKDRFFMPGNNITLDKDKYYPIFRNPHLSRNEQCALRPYYKGKKKRGSNIYYKYFGHLSGVIMVSAFSMVPQALGGADFDGDIVKVIDDERVRAAVLRSVYDVRDSENDKAIFLQRKLPIIVIPQTGKDNDSEVKDIIPFAIVKNTFSNRVGQISNLSIKLGGIEYGKEAKEVVHNCSECTILTGIEIDAAKTGEHPDIKEIVKYANEIKEDFDYVAGFKNKINDLIREHHYFYKNQLTVKKNKYSVKRRKYDNDAIIEYNYSEDQRNIDRLPKAFMDSISYDITLYGEMTGQRYLYFQFLKNNEWKKNIEDGARSRVAAVIACYNRLKDLYVRYYKYNESINDDKLEGYVKTILKLQYDHDKYNEMVYEVLPEIWTYIDSFFETKQDAENAISYLDACNWQYLLAPQKEKVLRDLFDKKVSDRHLYEDGAGDKVKDLLCNFDERGYYLLYYIIRDVILLFESREAEEEIMDKLTADDDVEEEYVIDREYYDIIYEEFYNKLIDRINDKRNDWNKLLMNDCKKKIDEILEKTGEIMKLHIFWSLRGSGNVDGNSQFFWEYVTKDQLDCFAVKGAVE